MEPKFKDQQIIQFEFPASGETRFTINNLQPVDKIRITCFDTLQMTEFTPVILLWTNLVDNYIGTIGDSYLLDSNPYDFQKTMRVGTGTEFFFTHKKILSGEYSLRLTHITGAVPANVSLQFYVVIEYFIY